MKHWVSTSGNMFMSPWTGRMEAVPQPLRYVGEDAPPGPVAELPRDQQRALAWLARGLRDAAFYAPFRGL